MNDSRPRSREELLTEAAAIDALEGARTYTQEELRLMDPFYVEARTSFDAVLSMLGEGSPTEPPPGLRERLLSRLSAEPEAAMDAQPDATTAPAERPEGSFEVRPGIYGVHTGDATWLDSPIPGLQYKTIHRDAERGYTTRLVRIEPGATYPPHRHGGSEEIFMLEGTLWVNGLLLKPGDYCRSEAGTEETGTISDTGATAIVVSSDLDEVTLPATS